jgi:hypothetical protein
MRHGESQYVGSFFHYEGSDWYVWSAVSVTVFGRDAPTGDAHDLHASHECLRLERNLAFVIDYRKEWEDECSDLSEEVWHLYAYTQVSLRECTLGYRPRAKRMQKSW